MNKVSAESEIKGHSFRNLLIFLVLYIVGSPFLVPYQSLMIVVHLSLSMSLFVAVYTVEKQQKNRTAAIVLLLPLLVLYWLGIYDIIRFSRHGAYLLFAVYFGLLGYSYFHQIMRARRVTVTVLYASFCLYLVIGLFWGALYALLHEIQPGAYGGTLVEQIEGATIHTFNYFSMVTLTTLGYGDITPQTIGAAALCQMEAIVGQFFTAVLVAWLVGMYILYREEERLEGEVEC